MKRAEIISRMAEGDSKKASAEALQLFIEIIKDSLVKGEKVHLIGFGTFEIRIRAPRTGLNPKTKEKVEIPSHKFPAFKAAKAFKDAINKN